MRTTLNIKDDIIKQVIELTGAKKQVTDRKSSA